MDTLRQDVRYALRTLGRSRSLSILLALTQKGESLTAVGKYDEAIADLESTLTYEPRHFGAWIGLGLVCLFGAFAYAELDLLICRAGMSTIAEVTVMGLPALYVPLSLGDGHQADNAREVVEAGGGMMVTDAEIGATRATKLVAGVMRNPQSLANLAAGAKRLGRPDAARDVAKNLLTLL